MEEVFRKKNQLAFATSCTNSQIISAIGNYTTWLYVAEQVGQSWKEMAKTDSQIKVYKTAAPNESCVMTRNHEVKISMAENCIWRLRDIHRET